MPLHRPDRNDVAAVKSFGQPIANPIFPPNVNVAEGLIRLDSAPNLCAITLCRFFNLQAMADSDFPHGRRATIQNQAISAISTTAVSVLC
jgi:hypothetical protein